MPEAVSPARAATTALVRLAVQHVAAAPHEEQRYLELNFALDRAVERSLRYRDLLELFEEGSRSAPAADAWAWVLAIGLCSNQMGDSVSAIRYLERAWTDLEQSGRGGTVAASFVQAELARAQYHIGSYTTAIATTNNALQLARAANSSLAAAYAHHYLGLISLRRRDFDYARRHILSARELFEKMNQRHGRARVLDSLAVLEIDLGNFEPARLLLEESLTVKEDMRDLRGQALTCGNLARLYAALGNYPQALHYLDRERDLVSRIGDERTATHVAMQLGELHLRHGELQSARTELLEACSLAERRQDERNRAYASFALSEVLRQLGDREAGLRAISDACAYFEPGEDPVMRDRAALRRAILEGLSPYLPEVQEPLDRLREGLSHASAAEALFEVADFFNEHNCTHQATTLYAEALDTAEPAQADQLANILRSRADSAEGREWVDAILTVKRQKDSLEQAYADLRRAEAMRESLTQMIVHDLKNPLAAITPWLQTMEMGVLSTEETTEYLHMAIEECGYLLRMIEDLNDVGKMQSQSGIELGLEPLSLREMAEDVSHRLQGRARECGMEIRLQEDEPLPDVPADRNKLRRLLENLVANAIKYGRPPHGCGREPVIWVGLHAEHPTSDEVPGSVRVEVRDKGEGIPVAEADRVFEAYYQAEAGRKRKAGVGLGLAFSRMVVEAHGGAIWTQPNPGGGTIFAFRLPCPALNAAAAA